MRYNLINSNFTEFDTMKVWAIWPFKFVNISRFKATVRVELATDFSALDILSERLKSNTFLNHKL